MAGAVDWEQPWYAGWRARGEAVAARLAGGMPLPDALNAQAGGAPACFVPHGELPAGMPYEQFAHVWCAQAALETEEAADAWLTAQCTAQALATKPFTPLAVLGVPGWHPENTNFSFYDDSHVFRSRKTPQQQSSATASVPRALETPPGQPHLRRGGECHPPFGALIP